MECLKCGKSDAAIENLCEECYADSNEIISFPQHIKIRYCYECGAFENSAGIWENGTALMDAVHDHVENSIKLDRNTDIHDILMEMERLSPNEIRVNARFEGAVGGRLPYKKDFVIFVRILERLCGNCSLKKGDYYEAILQVRAKDRSLDEEELLEIKSAVEGAVDSDRGEKSFIMKTEDIHGGLDFYMGNKGLTKFISQNLERRYGAETKESGKIMGQKDGRDLYRMTYLIRLPKYRRGDLVSNGKTLYLIRGMQKKSASARDLRDGKAVRLDSGEIKTWLMLGNIEDEKKETVVVSVSENDVAILDPVSSRTVYLLKPEGMNPEQGTNVFVVKNEEGECFLLDHQNLK